MNIKNNIYLLFSIVILISYSVEGKIHKAFSCEGHSLKLSCNFGYRIKIIKADYGRWNATDICQYFDDSEINLDCRSVHAKDIIKSKCNGHRTCSIKIDNEHLLLLEDPCPGQVKYAEAKYMCVKKPGTRRNHSHSSHKHVSVNKDELINKGISTMLNMANDYNNEIENGNRNYEIQPAYSYNPHFKTQFKENKVQPVSYNRTIGWNIFK